MSGEPQRVQRTLGADSKSRQRGPHEDDGRDDGHVGRSGQVPPRGWWVSRSDSHDGAVVIEDPQLPGEGEADEPRHDEGTPALSARDLPGSSVLVLPLLGGPARGDHMGQIPPTGVPGSLRRDVCHERIGSSLTPHPNPTRVGQARRRARGCVSRRAVFTSTLHVARVLGSAATEGPLPFTFVKLEHVIQAGRPAVFANATESVANVANVPEYVPEYVPNFIPRRVWPHPLVMRHSASCPHRQRSDGREVGIHSPRMDTHSTCGPEPK